MEFDILYLIQNYLRTNTIDQIVVKVFNDFVGAKGEIWIILGILLLLIPKTRKTALCLLSAYVISYFLGDVLKNLIARPRPCTLKDNVTLLISCPTSCSCPSVHSMLAFASAASIFWFHKKTGIVALVFAAMVAFSRLYFFVHFPTDVLLGAVLGFAIGTAVCFLFKAGEKRRA